MQKEGKNLRALLLRQRGWLLLLLPAALARVLVLLAQSAPAATEALFSRGLYPVLAQGFSFVTRLFPVSLTELALLSAPALLLLQLARAVRLRRFALRAVFRGLLALLSGLYAAFTLFWGLNYYRLPYASVAGLDPRPSGAQELGELYLELCAQANSLRLSLPGDGARPLAMPSREAALAFVPAAYAATAREAPHLQGNYGAPKSALLSYPLAKLNISGIFSPFTLEAQVNRYESPLLLPATACHEAAHQRGFAREDEANFIAYFVCVRSGEPYFAYSGTLLALMHAGSALAGANPESYARLRAGLSSGVRADMAAYAQNWAAFEGEAARMHERVNDAYLRANGQSEGVRSYGRMVDLLLALRRAGGLIAPSDPASSSPA